jgi:hypothetical protein
MAATVPKPRVVWTAALLVSARPEGGACATMLILAAGGLVFRKRKRQTVNKTGALVLDAIAIGYGCHFSRCSRCVGRLNRVAGKIKKAVYRSSGRRVRGEDDKIPAIKSVAPDVPLDVLRNMDIRVDPWCAPTCAPPNALRIRSAHARTSGTHVSRSDVPSYEGLGPCARHRIATRSHMQHRLRHPRVWRIRGQRKDRQVLGQVVPLAAAPSWLLVGLVRKASTRRYLSFDSLTEHLGLARCASSSAATRARPACSTELASTSHPLPAPRPPARPLPDGVAWRGQHRSRSGSPARPCLRVTEAPAAARDVDDAAPFVTAEGPGCRASSKRLWSGYVMPLALVRRIKEAESQLVKQLLYSGIVKDLGFT